MMGEGINQRTILLIIHSKTKLVIVPESVVIFAQMYVDDGQKPKRHRIISAVVENANLHTV
jgi:hypothetical protein